MSHIALYSPYVPKHSGGGEKDIHYMEEASSKQHKTTFLVPPKEVEEMKAKLPQYEAIFGLDLTKVNVQGSSIGVARGPVATMVETKQFSHLFAITDGSIFPSLVTHSYLIAQVPWTRTLSLSEKLKLNTWDHILVYSDFVKEILSHSWKTSKVETLAPYVDLELFKPQEKEKIILNVGRFFRHTTSNSKRQDIVIDAFKRLVDKGVLKDYSLVLIGNVDPNEDSLTYLEELEAMAFEYHIHFLTDLSF